MLLRFVVGLFLRLFLKRLWAPEHPYPAALDDCCAAYRWLLAQGHAPGQIAIAGDSAGGNLSLALLMRLRAQGLALASLRRDAVAIDRLHGPEPIVGLQRAQRRDVQPHRRLRP